MKAILGSLFVLKITWSLFSGKVFSEMVDFFVNFENFLEAFFKTLSFNFH